MNEWMVDGAGIITNSQPHQEFIFFSAIDIYSPSNCFLDSNKGKERGHTCFRFLNALL
jgi:hypothetical protein